MSMNMRFNFKLLCMFEKNTPWKASFYFFTKKVTLVRIFGTLSNCWRCLGSGREGRKGVGRLEASTIWCEVRNLSCVADTAANLYCFFVFVAQLDVYLIDV